MRGRRNTFMMQSNPVPARRSTHKLENKYITEVLLKGVRILCPTSGSSSLGVWLWKEDPPGQWGWSQELHRTGGERNFALGGCIQGFMHTRNWKKSTDFIGAWTRPICWSRRASWGAGEAMTHRGDEDTGGKRTREYSSVWTLLVAAILTAKSGDKKYPHCWSASGQQPAEQHHSPTRQKTGFLKYSWVHNHL